MITTRSIRPLPVVLGVCLLSSCIKPAIGQELGDARAGQMYAQFACADCHAVNPKQTVSPNPRLATFETIANTPGMTAIALTAWLQTSHKDMPNIMIPLRDRDNLIAYILSLKKP
jgi:mono/diheme cytochrome c family protein